MILRKGKAEETKPPQLQKELTAASTEPRQMLPHGGVFRGFSGHRVSPKPLSLPAPQESVPRGSVHPTAC